MLNQHALAAVQHRGQLLTVQLLTVQFLVPVLDRVGSGAGDGGVEVFVLDEVERGGSGVVGEEAGEVFVDVIGGGVLGVEEPSGEDLAVPHVDAEDDRVTCGVEAMAAAV
ncbi:hypothetical protein [Streptomyces nigrescens]|uniref:hypothetical protein n=1 Tax=Streptomyces nigrescens TaxID=1920 RepID=UPI0036C75DD8